MRRGFFVLASLMAAMLFIACGNPASKHPDSGAAKVEPKSASVTVVVVDYITQTKISNAAVSIKRSRGYDLENNEITGGATNANGKFLFYADTNVSVSVAVTKSGYSPNGKEIVTASGTNQILVFLKPVGVTDANGTSGTHVEDGNTQETITLEIPRPEGPSSGDLPEIVGKVEIPAGAIADTDGVSILVDYFDPDHVTALSNFPGGFVVDVVFQDGNESLTDLVTAGYIQIQVLDSEGNAIKSFAQPISVSVALPNGFINPATQQVIKAGDSIPVYSYDETEAQWVFHTESVAQADEEGYLYIEMTTDHLSYYAIAWERLTECTIRVQILGCDDNETESGILIYQTGTVHYWYDYNPNEYLIDFSDPNWAGVYGVNSQCIFTIQPVVPGDDNSTTEELEDLNPLRAVILDGNNSEVAEIRILSNDCGGTVTTEALPGNTEPLHTVAVSAFEQCSDGTQRTALPGVVLSIDGDERDMTGTDGTKTLTFRTSATSIVIDGEVAATGRYVDNTLSNTVDLSVDAPATTFNFILSSTFCPTGGEGGGN